MPRIRGTSHEPVSDHPSVRSRCATKTTKRRIAQTTPHDSPRTLVFFMPKISAKIDRNHPLRGRQMQVGWVKIGDFRQVASRKRYKIDAWFLLKSNRKSYALYRMVTLPMTLSALSAPNYPNLYILHRFSYLRNGCS